MKELLLYVETIKAIINRYYGKTMVSYNEVDGWYSRYHSGLITEEELVTWLMEITEPIEEDLD